MAGHGVGRFPLMRPLDDKLLRLKWSKDSYDPKHHALP
jgi:hypothetical protein